MSREIKFRFFSTVTGTFDRLSLEDAVMLNPQKISRKSLMEDLTFQQYTGLKDKNGVEIYEGDIVKWGHVEGFIEMSGVRFAVVDMSNSCDGLTFDAFKPVVHRFKIGNFMYRHSTDKCMEVIGNIHQNPELLK